MKQKKVENLITNLLILIKILYIFVRKSHMNVYMVKRDLLMSLCVQIKYFSYLCRKYYLYFYAYKHQRFLAVNLLLLSVM